MLRQRLTWAALVGAPVGVELWAVATGRTAWTLSPQLRWALRCHTRPGAAATTVLVGAGSAWLAHHLRELPPTDTPTTPR